MKHTTIFKLIYPVNAGNRTVWVNLHSQVLFPIEEMFSIDILSNMYYGKYDGKYAKNISYQFKLDLDALKRDEDKCRDLYGKNSYLELIDIIQVALKGLTDFPEAKIVTDRTEE